MASIRKGLLQFIFAGAFMKRWNDKLRPMELLEVDKQGHKMIVAWMLSVLNQDRVEPPQRLALGLDVVEGGLFEYLYRLVITDIKPPIFYKIKENRAHYQRLTAWVLGELEPRVQSLGPEFTERLSQYVRQPTPAISPESDTGVLGLPGHGEPETRLLARKILAASHLYASYWEFKHIKRLNESDAELTEIEDSFVHGLRELSDLRGVKELMDEEGTPLGRFARLCGRLRFQKRWSQTPRVPETSVLGHMFIVACYSYFFGLVLGAGSARLQNGFFSGLFHDLPELLTRDIISPVKKSFQGLNDLVREYEDMELAVRVFDPLRKGGYDELADRLGYLMGVDVGGEFIDCIREEGGVRQVAYEELNDLYNDDRFDPKDGRMLKICDTLAAFIEAYTALRNGISSDQLQQALWRMRSTHQFESLGEGAHIGALLADFD